MKIHTMSTLKAMVFLAVFLPHPAYAEMYETRLIQAISAPRPEAYCREYTRTVTINGVTQSAYGTACMQPDGSWEIQTPGREAEAREIEEVVTYMTQEPTRVIYMPAIPRNFYSRPFFRINIGSHFHRDGDWRHRRGHRSHHDRRDSSGWRRVHWR